MLNRTLPAVAVAVAVIASLAGTSCVASGGPTAADVRARVAEVVNTQASRDLRVLDEALREEFADEKPRFAGYDEPVTRSGVIQVVSETVRRDAVRVAVTYGDEDTGAVYCIFVDVPGDGEPRWTTAEADFTQADHCPTSRPERPDGLDVQPWEVLRQG